MIMKCDVDIRKNLYTNCRAVKRYDHVLRDRLSVGTDGGASTTMRSRWLLRFAMDWRIYLAFSQYHISLQFVTTESNLSPLVFFFQSLTLRRQRSTPIPLSDCFSFLPCLQDQMPYTMLDPLSSSKSRKHKCSTKKQHLHQVTPHEFRWACRQGTKALPDGPTLLEREGRKIPEKRIRR